MEDEGPERSSSLDEAISPSKLLKASPAQKEVSQEEFMGKEMKQHKLEQDNNLL